MEALDVSVVIPVHDEEENVVRLLPQIEEACASLSLSVEVVFVDDASRDSTWERLNELRPTVCELVLIRLRRNCGQTPAMAAGFDVARGRVVITMDGDLQNDPADIPAMLRECEQGYDLVCGWRKNRQDKLWTRKVPSKCANWLIRKVTGVTVHDYGCSLKAYRIELVRRMSLYSDMHRFLPFISQQVGARVGEIPVNHRARVYGRTKYGLSRVWKVLFDLLSLKVLVHYYRRLSLWFALMSLPVFAIFAMLLIASARAPVGQRQTLIGTTVVVASLGLFIGALGLVSEMVLKSRWKDFDRLLVVDDREGVMLP